MLRLAVTFILLLLMLFGAAVWLLDLSPQTLEPEHQAKTQTQQGPGKDASGGSVADDLSEALGPATKPADGTPKFDVARIDPTGTSVFAGRAEAGTLVTITIDGKAIGTAKVDDNGDWMLTTDAPISNPDGKLALFKAPPGTVPGVAGAEPQRATSKAAEAKPATKPQTAGAVASSMLKSLEGLVAAARTEEKQATAPTPDAAAASVAPEPSVTPSTDSKTAATAAPPLAPVNVSKASAPPVPTASVPVPITFVYNESTLTDDGRKAASLLLEYLQLKQFPKVTLTGHADERGSDELNMGLSRDRLETVAGFLRDGGYRGQLELIAKGKAEPFTGVVRSDFSQEDLWQLDRRVELVVSR